MSSGVQVAPLTKLRQGLGVKTFTQNRGVKQFL